MKDKKNILFVSISSDMYGSSKVLLSLILQLKNESEEYHPVVCMPLGDGPFKDILIANSIQIIEMPVVKLERSLLKSLKMFSLISEYFKAKKIVEEEIKGMNINSIQSNTVATLFGAIYCLFHKPKHIFHVHEIIDHPKIATYFFKSLLRFFCDFIVFNSQATNHFYTKNSKLLQKKSMTIVNGVDKVDPSITSSEINNIREKYFNAKEDQFIIGLVGRINRLKGHSLLLDTFEEVSKSYPNSKLCFIGSPPPNQDFFLTNLQSEVKQSNVADKVSFVGFQNNIFPILESLDLVIVPSTEQESFGLIIVEAMLAKKAVIGSNIGGISTIVDHKKTGLLFEVNNKKDLAEAILLLMSNRELKENIEACAHIKALELYSTNMMYNKFDQLYKTIL